MGVRRLAKVAIVGAVALSLGCIEATLEEEDAQRYAQEWSEGLEAQLQERAVAAAEGEAIEATLRQRAEEQARARVSLPIAELLEAVYDEREFRPALVDEQGLSAAGEAVWEVLQQLEHHHLDPEPYQRGAIEEALDTWEGMRADYEEFDGLQAQADEEQMAVEWLMEQPEEGFEGTEEVWLALTEDLLEREAGQRLQGAVQSYEATVGEVAEAAAEVEVLLAQGLARYGHEQRYSRIKEMFVHPRHWDYYSDPDVEDSGRRPDGQWGRFRGGQVWREAANLAQDMAEENKIEILDEKLKAMIREVFESDDPAQRVGAIEPTHPQYAGLVKEHRRYQEIVDDGGWEEVERNDRIGPGSTHSVVADLKERLKIEGYYDEEEGMDEDWNEALTEAVRAYQETHQLRVTGRPHQVFWYSLNIPAERRLAQIELNLDRWRDSNVEHERDRYAFVNIPDFSIEVYEEQERIKRMKTIVGSNEKGMNPMTDEEEYFNRTPTPMAAYIDRVAFNPYWNVPRRLRAQQITPQVRESLEEKYALKLDAMARKVEEGEEFEPSEISLASIRSDIRREAEEKAEAREREAEEASEESEEQSLLDQNALAAAGGVELDTEEESPIEFEDADSKAQRLLEERLSEALETWTYEDQVYNEAQERHVTKRFFESGRIEALASEMGVDTGEGSVLAGRLFYLDWEEYLVDAELTDGDRVPSWYEANDYEVMFPGNENWEYVRMLPSEFNSLGMVKIIFPNYDNIYLHDTPERHLFQSEVRGFSAGCIRLEKPYELSELFLELDGQLEDVDIDQILADEDYHPIFLDRHVPIFLEYYTVRVDDEGRANFLADIYRYDRDAFEEREAEDS